MLIFNPHEHPFNCDYPELILQLYKSQMSSSDFVVDLHLQRDLAFDIGLSFLEWNYLSTGDLNSMADLVSSLHYLSLRNHQSANCLRLFDYNDYSLVKESGSPFFWLDNDLVGEKYSSLPCFSSNNSFVNQSHHHPRVSVQILYKDSSLNLKSLEISESDHSRRLSSYVNNLLQIQRDWIYNHFPIQKRFYIENVQSVQFPCFRAPKTLRTPKNKHFLSMLKKIYQIEFPTILSLISDSSKLNILDQLLRKLKKAKHRVLIFCQMTKMMNIIEDYLQFRKFKYFRLDGGSAINERQEMVNGFQTNDEIFVFLLSTRAGGLGVTLTAADDVIFYDNDWNPTMDAQAEDRAHRIGKFWLNLSPSSIIMFVVNSLL